MAEPFAQWDADEEDVDFGACCACGGFGNVRNVIMLPYRSPEPGVGCWGCFVCGLDLEGAVTVLCDSCFAKGFSLPKMRYENIIKYAVLGVPAEGRRIPIAELTEAFDHDLTKHQEYERRRAAVRSPFSLN